MMRRLFKPFLVFFGVLVFPGLGFAAAKIPYWAGYETKGYLNDEYDGNV